MYAAEPHGMPSTGAPAPEPGRARRSEFQTSDIEVATSFIRELYADTAIRATQNGRGFSMSLSGVDAGRFRLDDLRLPLSLAFRYQGTETLSVVRVRRGGLALREPGFDVRCGIGDVLLAVRPETRSFARTSGLDEQIITLSSATVGDVAGWEPESRDLAPKFTDPRPVSRAAARRWRRVADHIAGLLRDGDCAPSPLVIGGADRLLAAVALSTFPNTAEREPERVDPREAMPDTARRAIAFIESNPDRDIGLADIARAAHVTPRALQLAFRRHLDMTPMGYLRRVRLDQAHLELLDAIPGDGLTVTEVAMRWGFANPSRFAQHYAARYGEPPSHTLRR